MNAFPEAEVSLHAASAAFVGAFTAVAAADLGATTEELKFLEGLNTTLADQYTASHGSLRAVAEFSASLLDTHGKVAPLLAQIDDIDRAVTDLENTVRALDKYTDRMAQQVRDLYEL